MSAPLRELERRIDAVREHERGLARRHAWARGAATAAAVTGAVALPLRALDVPPAFGGGVALLALVVAGGLVVAAFRRLQPPTDAQLARAAEERAGGLDDVVVSAVAAAARQAHDAGHDPALASLLASQAVRALDAAGADTWLAPSRLTRAGRHAAVATLALTAGVGVLGPSLQHGAAWLVTALAPTHVAIAVTPGDVRVRAGTTVRIEARVSGAASRLQPVLQLDGVDGVVRQPMRRAGADGTFEVALTNLQTDTTYHVESGAAASARHVIRVQQPPRVARIALRYDYPKALGLPPRRDDESGDVYAPAGTAVRVDIEPDQPVRGGALVMADGTRVPLSGAGAQLSGSFAVTSDGTYRVAFADEPAGEVQDSTEYFIRVVLDRPPDVRMLRPGGDTRVTPLQEVTMAARAEDDYGIAQLDLVIMAPGGRERVVPLARGAGPLAVEGRHVLALEDLGVSPGDVVSYYARARDLPHGKPASETRSDMFFLEVTPFEEAFVVAQSQAMAMSAAQGRMDDLAAAQKDLITATWTLDRRARRARTAAARAEVATLAEAQTALRRKAERVAGQANRAVPDPRRRAGTRASGAGPGGDDPMARAVDAMTRAAAALAQGRTTEALPHETEALSQLLKAEADIERRQVARQQAGGSGLSGNRQAPDLSDLFDQELRRLQDTHYETPPTAATRSEEAEVDPLARLRDLARRQEALAREQRDLAARRDTLDTGETRRQLERLTREQDALRRQADQLARDRQRGAMREATDAMRQASGQLQQQDAASASESGARAASALRAVAEAQAQATPDARARAFGDVRHEARALAEAQQALVDEAARPSSGAAADDARRQRAGTQARLADRTERLASRAREAAGAQAPEARSALAEAARALGAGQIAEQMRAAAEAWRRPGAPEPDARAIASALERVAGGLDEAGARGDAEARRQTAQLGRTRALRDRMAAVDRALDALADSAPPSPSSAASSAPSPSTRPGDARGGGDGPGRGTEASRRRDAEQAMREVRQLAGGLAEGGQGGTPEDWQPSVSAPGTEAFKQDYSRWETLKAQLLLAVERVEREASEALRRAAARDRLPSGSSDDVPEAYRRSVEEYYRRLAAPPSGRPPQ